MSGPASSLNPRVRFSFTDPRFIILLVGFVALLATPFVAFWVNDTFMISFIAKVMIFAIAAASLDLILGYGGMVSFGHAAYLGLGAYAVAIWSKYGVDYDVAWMQDGYLQFATAIVGSALVALVIGAISLRTSGLYFIMITLAFTQMLYYLGISLEPFGGDDGMNVDRSNFVLFSLNDNILAKHGAMRDGTTIYFFCFAILIAVLFLLRRIVNSRFGMVIRGSQSNPVRMQAIGFPTYRYRLSAFVIAGAICGIAGALFANHQEFLTPEYMSWFRSGEIIVMVIMGGIGTIFGSVFGAVGYLFAEEFLQDVVGSDYWMIVLGPMLILLVLFARRGLFGLVPDRIKAYPTFHLRLNIFVAIAALFFWHLAVFPRIWIIVVQIVILLAARAAADVRGRVDTRLVIGCGAAFVAACAVMALGAGIGVGRAAPPLIADVAAMLLFALRRLEWLMAGVAALVCAVALAGVTAIALPWSVAIGFVVAAAVVAVALAAWLKSPVRGTGITALLYFAATLAVVLGLHSPLLTAVNGLVAVAYVLFTALMVMITMRDRLPEPGGGRLERPQHA
jgi:branched-chain amino acid transport system permease protein